jgi:hypothetical protein
VSCGKSAPRGRSPVVTVAMIRPRSPLLIATFAVAVTTVAGGVYLVARRIVSRATEGEGTVAWPATPEPGGARARVSARAPGGPRAPRVTVPAAIEGGDSAAPGTPQQLDQIEREARRTAAARLALTPEQTARISAIHEAGDARRAAIEGTAGARPGSPIGELTRKLGESARREVQETVALLGPERARELRRAEAEAFKAVWDPLAYQPEVSSELRVLARRRLAFMRTGTAGTD